jgi:hypothetical protein
LVSLFDQINDLVNKQNAKADFTFVTLIKNKPDGIKLDYNWRSASYRSCSSFFSNQKKLERRESV